MNLEWSGREEISAAKDQVWRFVNDPQSVASCLPDLVAADVRDEHTFDATVRAAVGPVRGNLKFRIKLDPQPDNEHLTMTISGGGFGSVVDLIAGAHITGDDRHTTLDWQGRATMRGPLATVGGRVLDVQAQRVISTTFANVKTRTSAAHA